MKNRTAKIARINVRVDPKLRSRIERYGKDEGIGDISDTCRYILATAMTSIYGRPITMSFTSKKIRAVRMDT